MSGVHAVCAKEPAILTDAFLGCPQFIQVNNSWMIKFRKHLPVASQVGILLGRSLMTVVMTWYSIVKWSKNQEIIPQITNKGQSKHHHPILAAM
jgi:hypothetical protein